MKLKYIYSFFIFTLFLCTKGQTGSSLFPQQNTETLFTPTSPEAYSFDKAGKLPLDLFNGKANISIPIYTIKMGTFTFPINLTYNTGGIKLNEVASTVGLGWALSMPNTLTKNVVGGDDEKSPIIFKDYDEAVSYAIIDPINDNIKKDVLSLLYDGGYDTNPDLFSHNLPTTSGSFIMNNNIGYPIPHEDIRIRRTNGSYNIADTQGNNFWLSGKNAILSRRSGVTPSLAVNLYLLDSLKTNRNENIKFQYQTRFSYTEEGTYESKIVASGVQVPALYFKPPLNTSIISRYDANTNYEKLITKIVFPDGQIIFKYSGEDGLTTVGHETYRKDVYSDNGYALKKIIVINNAGVVIKDFTFNYSYFESSPGNPNYLNYRLKLIGITDNLQNNMYSFTYNESTYLPARNSYNDDYWGYINSISGGTTNIPQETITNFLLSNTGVPPLVAEGRNRGTNQQYAQLGILTSIKYPTGAVKNLYYENNTIESIDPTTSVVQEDLTALASDVSDVPDVPVKTAAVVIPPSQYAGKTAPMMRAIFSNGCLNNSNGNGNPSEITPTFCRGIVSVDGITKSSTGAPFIVDFSATSNPINLKLTRSGDCGCDISIKLRYDTINYGSTTRIVGGLRIRKIEDIDQNNISNVFEYEYKKPDTGQMISSGVLKKPFSFIKPYYRVLKPLPDNLVPLNDYIEEHQIVETTNNAFNSYNSSNIVTYSQVTEKNGLGEVVYEFNDSLGFNGVYNNSTVPYDSWKYGGPSKITYRKNGNILKTENFSYAFNPVKNQLAGFTNISSNMIAFGVHMDIVPYYIPFLFGSSVLTYQVNLEPIKIYGAAVEKTQSKTTEYFKNNKVVETVTDYAYSDTDINKPINLTSTKTTFQDGSFDQASYQYAHEKNNQLMIDKNMIGIPLETEVKKGSTTVSKAETLYPTSVPTAQTGSLVLPTSVVSYNLQSPATASTEVTYDKYDAVGHIQQYTTKNGISTTIIWGYNNTQPIAKIEGAKLSDISQSLIDAVVSASDLDASAALNNDETALLSALNTFKTDSGLSVYQITTYTYDPLVGVRSVTPPSGIREVYLYDSANRLKEVREQNQTGKLLKEYQYHYKN